MREICKAYYKEIRPCPNVISRRRFLGQTAATTAAAAAAQCMIKPSWAVSPNEKLNIAAIGVGGRGADDLTGVASENIVALCDVDQNNLRNAAKRFPVAKLYADFRKMLAEMDKQIDAVVVGTPDHMHAPVGVMAMEMGKHCYCEKPLSHRVAEARKMADLAKAKKLVTQMGTQIHASNNYRRVVELVQAGAIGPIGEVHVWADCSWCGGSRPAATPPCPAYLDWDLWLGPAPYRPYHPVVRAVRLACLGRLRQRRHGRLLLPPHDLAFWALKLRHPTTVAAEGPEPDPESCPPWLIVHYEFPAREDCRRLSFTWYDGGMRPPIAAGAESSRLGLRRALRGREGDDSGRL